MIRFTRHIPTFTIKSSFVLNNPYYTPDRLEVIYFSKTCSEYIIWWSKRGRSNNNQYAKEIIFYNDIKNYDDIFY